MCGRYVLDPTTPAFQARFNLDSIDEGFAANFNVSPTQIMPVIIHEQGRRLELMKWGLIPSWAKDPKIGQKMINARSETVTEKPAFRNALKRRRALIPAGGFYEWKTEGKTKTPYLIRLKDEDLFAMAGLWEVWKDPEGNWLKSYTILTTSPNELMAPIHNRMPVILSREGEAAWLSEGELSPPELAELFTPFPAERMIAGPYGQRPS